MRQPPRAASAQGQANFWSCHYEISFGKNQANIRPFPNMV